MVDDGLRDPAEGDAARENVAEQLAELIRESRTTGSMELVVSRVRAVGGARASGDVTVLRSALMELSAASAALVVHLDLAEDADTLAPLHVRKTPA